MTDTTDRTAACARLGIPDRELVDVTPSPAGIVYNLVDGTSLIDVPADRPDHDGKVGLMFTVAPGEPGAYKGNFPIFTNPPDDTPIRDTGIADVVAAVATVNIDALDRNELAAVARDLGITDATAKWSRKRLVEAITAAKDAAAQASAADDQGDGNDDDNDGNDGNEVQQP